MENASKALVMAGGVLIGILILSLAVYLFVDFGSTAAKINEQNAQQQIVEFNSKFTSYQGYKDKNEKWQITIYDIISLAGYAKENNEYYDGIDDEQIDVIITNGSLNSNIANSNYTIDYESLISTYTETNGDLTKFEYLGVTLNNRGKVKQIKFKAL